MALLSGKNVHYVYVMNMAVSDTAEKKSLREEAGSVSVEPKMVGLPSGNPVQVLAERETKRLLGPLHSLVRATRRVDAVGQQHEEQLFSQFLAMM